MLLNLNLFKQNLQELMLNYLTAAMQNFIRQFEN